MFEKIKKNEQPFLIILITILSLMANAQPRGKIYAIDTLLYPYIFKAGSNWVYENDSTKLLDTITLTKSQHYYEIVSKDCGLTEINVSYFTNKNNRLDSFRYFVSGTHISLKTQDRLFIGVML